MKPYLKWAGGKSRLSDSIREELGGRSQLYVEPFCGALAVFLARSAHDEVEAAILSDANRQLISTHLAVQRQIDDLLEALDKLPWGENYAEHYDRIRGEFNALDDRASHVEIGSRFIWLNKACFNGLYRVNKKGDFNVPVGRYKRPARPTEDELREVSTALQRATLLCSDFREIPGIKTPYDRFGNKLEIDQVYVDPPYVPLSATAAFTSYTQGGFDYDHQMELALLCAKLADRNVRVVASNHDAPEVQEMYERLGFAIRRIEVARSVGASRRTRKKVGEILAVR